MMCQSVEESLPSAVNLVDDCLKFFEGAKTPQFEWVVPFLFLGHFEPFLAIGIYKMVQKIVESMCGGEGLTLDVAHLVRPPESVFECRWKDNALSSSLIAVVDACHVTLLILRLVLV